MMMMTTTRKIIPPPKINTNGCYRAELIDIVELDVELFYVIGVGVTTDGGRVTAGGGVDGTIVGVFGREGVTVGGGVGTTAGGEGGGGGGGVLTGVGVGVGTGGGGGL